MIYTKAETLRFQSLLSAFEGYISESKYFDILYSSKRGYIHVLLEKDIVDATYIKSSDDLFALLVNEVTHDVRDLFLCGEHNNVYLFPEEIEECRNRLMPCLERLPDDLKLHFTEKMEHYFANCNSGDKELQLSEVF